MSTSTCLDRATDQYAANRYRGQAPLDAAEAEIWHAQVGAGDVRRLTLEQLDELYRADVINERTYLWQPGRTEWATLSAVLAEHPEPPEPETFHVLMKDRSVRVVSVDVLDALYQGDVIDENTYLWQEDMNGWKRLSELVHLEEAEPVTNPMATRAPMNDAVTVRYNEKPGVRESAAPTVRYNPVPVAVASIVPSAPPVTLSLSPEPETREPSRSGTWLVRMGIAAGLLLVLGRNDAFLGVASAAKQAPSYLQTERKVLGGPVFGTTRAVEGLVASLGGPLQPVRVPLIVSSRLPVVAAPAPKPEQASTKTKPLPTAPVASSAAGSPPPSRTLANNVAAALGAKASVPVPVRRAPKSAAPRKSSSKASKLKGSSNYYDPLNGAL